MKGLNNQNTMLNYIDDSEDESDEYIIPSVPPDEREQLNEGIETDIETSVLENDDYIENCMYNNISYADHIENCINSNVSYVDSERSGLTNLHLDTFDYVAYPSFSGSIVGSVNGELEHPPLKKKNWHINKFFKKNEIRSLSNDEIKFNIKRNRDDIENLKL